MGEAKPGELVFITHPFQFSKDTIAIRRLRFTKLENDKVQHAEISIDEGKTWKTEYDLEYRRKS